MSTAVLTPQQKKIVTLLFAVQVAAMAAMEMSGPFWPVHLNQLTASPDVLMFSSIGVYVLPMLGIMLTSRFWGRLGDRVGRKWMLLRALLGLAITQMALAYADSVGLILLLRFIQGGCAGYIATAQAYGVQVIPFANRARFFAFLQVSTNVGSLVGATLGGFIYDTQGFFWINVSGSLVCLLCVVIIAFALPAVASRPSHEAHSETQAAPERQLPPGTVRRLIAVLFLLVAALLCSRMMVTTNFARYVQTTFDVGNWVSGLAYGLWAMGFICTAALWARYFERFDWQPTLKRLLWVVLACAGVNAALASTPWVSVFIAGYFLWGALLGATLPVLLTQISRLAKQEQQGELLGMAQSVQQFANISGIALGAVIAHQAGLASTYWAVAVGYGGCVVLLAVVVWVTRRW
ncbi:hypothetical protein BGP77_00245 [Saccharospirillum sp. MSK14-1]|uniref:MFS transporter n=1 Tax=Saccharospirillum sp. MSK14-1 TaxID=1897632 RepID=UPI000D4BB8CE|nr:MFS transporter [Saccharospirillum sp. MSK14-1]PTY35798.1 hypothetical protein BGP77_00245 [Saccharospirillum sp. MSK14-1]